MCYDCAINYGHSSMSGKCEEVYFEPVQNIAKAKSQLELTLKKSFHLLFGLTKNAVRNTIKSEIAYL